MITNALGKRYRDGECIVYEGDPAESLFVVVDGCVEVAYAEEHRTTRLMLLRKGELFGEAALFSRESRSASVRAVGEARVLTLDRKVLLRRIKEDPVLALELLRSMSRRIRALEELVKGLRTDGDSPTVTSGGETPR